MYVNINDKKLVNMDEVLTVSIDHQTETTLTFFFENPTERHELECTYRTPERAKEAYREIVGGIAAGAAIVDI